MQDLLHLEVFGKVLDRVSRQLTNRRGLVRQQIQKTNVILWSAGLSTYEQKK